jgi:hypothetical protein
MRSSAAAGVALGLAFPLPAPLYRRSAPPGTILRTRITGYIELPASLTPQGAAAGLDIAQKHLGKRT